jgi:hypothetical protein
VLQGGIDPGDTNQHGTPATLLKHLEGNGSGSGSWYWLTVIEHQFLNEIFELAGTTRLDSDISLHVCSKIRVAQLPS